MDNSEHKKYLLICFTLGLLGAFNCIIIGCYILTSFMFLPVEQLLFEACLGMGLMIASAVTITYGSYIILKKETKKGGIINLLAGTLIPIPVCTYFALFSQRTLSWIGAMSVLLLTPAVLSGTISILTQQARL